jgi:hypothetical protein
MRRYSPCGARQAKKVERAPQAVIDEAIGRLITLFE